MKLNQEFEKTMSEFKRKNSTMSFKNRLFYEEWLAQTYFFVAHSTSLLGLSLPHLKNLNLKHQFEKHLAEESRHDLLALRDLQKQNRDICEFKELAFTQAFYHSQYYRVQFEGGESLLGYILFLEGIAVHWGKEIFELTKSLHSGISFIKVHAEEDPDHLKQALQKISGLPFKEQEKILLNFHYSHEIYQGILENLKVCEIKKEKAA